ncbi:MAG: hypothetical protein V3U92_09045 [Cellulophaga sp.]
MKLKKNCALLFIAFFLSANAQKNILNINSNIVMPKDSLKAKALLFSVNAFLLSAQENSQNKWILPTEIVETQILIDEIQDIQKSKEFENDSFFKAYVTNIIPIELNDYVVKISYIGIYEGSPILRASFELIAHKADDSFLISSPLIRHTQNWKSKIIQNHTFHYPYGINDEKAQIFANKVIFYDEKVKNNKGEFHYYLEKDGIDPLKLIGVEYKSDYNGYEFKTRWEAQHDRKSLWVANESRVFGYDLHDLWHNRLRRVIPRNEIHRYVDCYIATIYGGMWGESWENLFSEFCKKFVVGKNVNWLENKTDFESFIPINGHKVYVDDFVGALLIQKIEKEKGFEGVWELLNTKRTKIDEEFFQVLEKLTRITKKTYNKEVSKLIREEMRN